MFYNTNLLQNWCSDGLKLKRYDMNAKKLTPARKKIYKWQLSKISYLLLGWAEISPVKANTISPLIVIFLDSELSPEMSGLYRICYICLHTWIQKEIVRKKGRGSITKGIQSGHTPSHLLRKNYLRFLELSIRLNVKLYEMLRVLRRIKKR